MGFKSNKIKINAEKRYLNRKFGRLRVVNIFSDETKLIADCVCDCGNMKSVLAYNLWSGMTQSCGCLREEQKFKVLSTIPKEDFIKIKNEYLLAKKNGNKISYNEIANRYGVSRQRIFQIVRGR